MAFWYISDASIVNKLISRAQAGVRVRVIVDPRANLTQAANAQYLNQLQAAGIPMRYKSSPFDSGGILHMKMALFAGQNKVEFGSANYSPYSFTTSQPLQDYTLNAIYFTDDRAIVNSFKTQFDNLWTNTVNYANYANVSGPLARQYATYPLDPALNFPPGTPGQDFDAFATRSVAAFNQETQKIDASVYRVTDRRFSDAMISAVGRGVTVRLLTEPDEYRNVSQLWDAYHIDRMYAAGVQIKKRAHRGQTHQKSAVAYSQGLAIFGSSNWTANSSNAQAEQNYFTTKAWMFNWFVNQFESKWNAPAEYQPFVPLPPDQPVNLFPANGVTSIASDVKLMWQGGPWAHKYDIYFGTTPEPPLLAADVTTGSPEDAIVETYAPQALTPGTKYYWRVVGKTMAGQTAAGPTWSFTTAGSSLGGPNVVSIMPSRASGKGGATVQISGANFVPEAIVTIGGAITSSVTVTNSSAITVTVPAHQAGSADVIVINPDGQSSRLAASFTFIEPPLLPAPTITAISPASGAAGTRVTISGTGFTAGSTVSFDGVPAGEVIVNSYTSLSAVAPAHAAGVVSVTVQTPQDQRGTLAAYTYMGTRPPTPAPTIASVLPNSGSTDGGQVVTINGTGFSSGAVVTFDGAAAFNVSVINSTTLAATTPAHTAGPVDVVVTNNDGQSGRLAGTYRYLQPPAPAPTVSGVSPSSGPTAGGAMVTISGSGFTSGAVVKFDGVAATNVSVTSITTINAKTPAHTAGSVHVVITNADGQSGALERAFTYIAPPPPPMIAAVSPPSGSTVGGTQVTISGSGFQPGALVSLDGVPAEGVRVIDATTIQALTMAHAAGRVEVAVLNPDGQMSTLPRGFTYVALNDPPTVSITSPQSGDILTARDQVRIRVNAADADGSIARVEVYAGTTLIDAATASPYVVSWTPVAAGSFLLRAVAVDNQGATTSSQPVTVTVTALIEPLSISEILPNWGTIQGGTTVTIHGGGFTTGLTLTIGGAVAGNLQIASSTTLTATTPAHAAGVADVVITRSGGQNAMLPHGFTYTAPPNATPQVSITATPTTGEAPVSVQFTATATDADGQVIGYRWEFGDGQTSTEISPTHVYEVAGTYRVQLTVTDNQGAAASASLIVEVAQAKVAMRIIGARAKGRKLFVFGENFAAGSVILVDGEEKTTRNDDGTPQSALIAKKGGKQIAPGQTVYLQVRSADGKLSNQFSFTRPTE